MPPKKKLDDATPYNPIAADLAREVAATGRIERTTLSTVNEDPEASSGVAAAEVEPFQSLNDGNAAHSLQVIVTKQAPANRQQEDAIAKRVVLARSEDADLTAFLMRLQQASVTKVSFNIIARALFMLLMQREEQLLAEIKSKPISKQPAKNDSIKMAEFEEQWFQSIASALRRGSAYRAN